MLDLFGNRYVSDCCISVHNQKMKEENFRIYITDVGAALINMFSKTSVPRFYDMMHKPKVETRTGEEIAQDIIARHGLKVVE